jgi:2'-5' RNA ligase
MSEGKRLFVGVQVSVATANALARCAEQLARRARDAKLEIKWVSPANYHVTLKFLGWTQNDAVAAVSDRLETALVGAQGFRFRTSRLGAFPSLDKATILWAGIEDPKPLTELAERVERAAAELGYKAETRPFHPHVTLARVRETRLLRDVVLPMSEQMFSETRVDSVILYESETKSSGSVYKEISRIVFKTAEINEKRQTGALELGDETEQTDDGWPRRQ